MWDKIKRFIKSEKMMTFVNVIFLLSLLAPRNGVIFIAYGAWILYLFYCIKSTKFLAVKIVDGIFCVFAVCMIVFNLYFIFKAR